MADRVARIVSQVKSNIAQRGTQISESNILYHLEQCQIDVAKRANAIQEDGNLTTVVGQEAYTVDPEIHRVVEIIEPDEWLTDIEVVTSPKRWKNLKRIDLPQTQPLYAFFWAGEIRLLPAPQEILLVEFLAYSKPTLSLVIDGAIVNVSTEDPEVGSEYDACLIFGTTARVLQGIPGQQDGFSSWNEMYEIELAKQDAISIKNQDVEPHTVDSSEEGLYF